MAIYHTCFHAGCGELIPLSQEYCSKHAKDQKKDGQWSYKKRMALYGKYQKFYKSAAWRKLSQKFKETHPFCLACLETSLKKDNSCPALRLAQVTDHVVPIQTAEGWKHRLDPTNLQPLCIKHNSIKRLKDQKKYGYGGVTKRRTI